MTQTKYRFRYKYKSYGIVILDENDNQVGPVYNYGDIKLVRHKVYDLNGWKQKDKEYEM